MAVPPRTKASESVSNRRLGFGTDFDEKLKLPSGQGVGWRSRRHLQRLLLDEIRRQMPQALNALAGEPLRLYQAIPLSADGPTTRLPGPGGVSFVLPPIQRHRSWPDITSPARAGDPQCRALRAVLEAWHQQFFAGNPPWLLYWAVETLNLWRNGAPPEAQRDWAPDDDLDLYHSPTLEEPPAFQFNHDGWSFWREAESDWIAQLTDAFERARDEYIAQSKDVARKLGLEPTVAKRTGSEWHVPEFVRFQWLGVSKRSISEAHGVSFDAVRKAFQDIANLAGIRLRSEGGGRPKGARDVHPRPTRRRR
jgi:hypothetical protein